LVGLFATFTVRELPISTFTISHPLHYTLAIVYFIKPSSLGLAQYVEF